MADLSDFKSSQIVGARMAGVSVTKAAELFAIARSTVSKVMTAFDKERKTSGRKRKLSDRVCRTLTQIVRKDHKNTALKITAELNDYLEDPVSPKTVRMELHNVGFHGRAEIILKKLFEISRCFHFFVQHYIYIYIYMLYIYQSKNVLHKNIIRDTNHGRTTFPVIT